MGKKRSALVTGGAGFIGTHLVKKLLSENWKVLSIDALRWNTHDRLEAWKTHPDFTFLEADLSQSTSSLLERVQSFGPIDLVWHLAANSDIGSGNQDPEIDLKDTFLTTFFLLELMKRTHADQLVFASSSAVYGEHDQELTEETAPLRPISQYGAMKLASEAAIHAATETFLKKAWIFRFPNVVGPYPTHGVIYDFFKKLKKNKNRLDVLGDGTQEKPYLHVEDLLEAMFLCIQKEQGPYNLLNVSGKGTTSVRFIAEQVAHLSEPSPKILYGKENRGWIGDVPKFRYNTKKIEKLGWSCEMTSDECVKKAIEEIRMEFTP